MSITCAVISLVDCLAEEFQLELCISCHDFGLVGLYCASCVPSVGRSDHKEEGRIRGCRDV